jgi:Double-GTPase 1
MPNQPLQILIAGYPEEGKSTYLAAFWHSVANRPGSSIAIDLLHGNQEYLQGIERLWMDCKPVGRTTQVDASNVFPGGSESVKLKCGDEKFELIIPDVSGETYNHLWERREIPGQLAESMRTCNGVLLFVNPLKLKEGTRIADEAYVAGDAPLSEDLGSSSDAEDESPTSGDLQTWSPKKAPSQPKLVEILQTIAHLRRTSSRFRVAIVVSAWDSVNVRITFPSEWIAKRTPLLNQYLKSNASIFEVEIFGVSAQGGSYKGNIQELLSKDNPWERISVVGSGGCDKDICRPMLWALGR